MEHLGLERGFEPPDLDRPGRLPHEQGLCEARLGYQDESPQLGARDPVPGQNLHADTAYKRPANNADRMGRGKQRIR